MIDIETLATSHDAVITQIGACVFDLHSDGYESFRFDINWRDQLDRKIDPETLSWWLDQEEAAIRSALLHGGFRDLWSTIKLYLHNLLMGADRVWANDPTFDLAILRDAGLEHSFRKERSCRTMFDLSVLLSLPSVHEVSEAEVKHDAEHDAIYQAQCMRAIFKDLKALGAEKCLIS